MPLQSWLPIMIPLILGWFLGIASQLVVDFIRRRRECREARQAILNELRGLQTKLVAGSMTLIPKYEGFDKKYLDWYIPLAEKYVDPVVPIDSRNTMLAKLKKLSNHDIEQWDAMVRSQANSAISLTKFELHLTKNTLSRLHKLDRDFVAKVVFILSHVDILNKLADEAWYYYDKTFDSSLSEINRQAINSNLNGVYESASRQVRILCDNIDNILQTPAGGR